ncbi:MAG TPA: inorganic pyrophosphatase [Ignavibacteria bacterium]|nr:inorganic pyrophosphatase [Ignavibacteria bacterium]
MKEKEEFKTLEQIWKSIRLILKSHPWHGIEIGKRSPAIVNSYIEIVPTDTVKYEIDKASGYLKVDRPQKYSNICPTPYGFIPQTYCGESVAEFCMEKSGKEGIVGDGDPLDICVLTEKEISHSDIFLVACPIGGLRMIDGGEADDKIIAVMHQDDIFGYWDEIDHCPKSLINRLKHYFLTYKEEPGREGTRHVEITDVYGRDEAYEIIERSHQDYLKKYGDMDNLLKNKFE